MHCVATCNTMYDMFYKPRTCPRCSENESVWKESKGKGAWYIKKGYYKTKYNAQYVPRYFCKRCKHAFSSRSHLPNYKQKKPQLNKLIYKWYSSGTTQRRIAINLGINVKTVARKFLYLAKFARDAHRYRLDNDHFKTDLVQFDEMESYEHTLAKPVSIAVAVDARSGHIISLDAATIKSHGKLIGLSKEKYGHREDTRDAAREDSFIAINKTYTPGQKIITDKNTAYPAFVERLVPYARLEQVYSASRNGERKGRRNTEDDLWRVNHICAKIRHDMARLGRKTWVTTKRMWALQAQLELYIAYNNGYKLF